jgi:hypothetical protein
MAFLLGKWKLFAAIGAVIALLSITWYIYERGKDAERVRSLEKVQDNVRAANEVENRNNRSSDDDITKRLYRWQRD